MNILDLQKSIRLKYVVGLTLIALLSTVSFYVLYKTLEESRNTAYIVNISGKQRMLSQHIALDIHRLYKEIIDGRDTEKIIYSNGSLQILLAHAKEMAEANKILSSGFLPNGSIFSISNGINEMYFGDMDLKNRVDIYLQTANKIVEMSEYTQINTAVKKIDLLSESLLVDLNKVVLQYQRESESKLDDLEKLEIAAWVFVIIVLLLEVIFIFQPLTRRVFDLYTENKSILENLENEVMNRTIKLKDANVKLENLAFHDPLTGLKNRLTLEQDIEKAIQHERDNKSPYAVLMFDIDWFKNVNDTYGHDVGDTVIKEVARFLIESVREEDKVYRAGGEEFVVLLNRISYENTNFIAQEIRQRIEKHSFRVDDTSFCKTISCGLYHSSISDSDNVRDVLKLVDKALYQSKANGRNRVTDISASKDKS